MRESKNYALHSRYSKILGAAISTKVQVYTGEENVAVCTVYYSATVAQQLFITYLL